MDKLTFDKSIDELNDMYEEGKTCLHQLSILIDEQDSYHRLFDIIKDLRKIAATALRNQYNNGKNDPGC